MTTPPQFDHTPLKPGLLPDGTPDPAVSDRAALAGAVDYSLVPGLGLIPSDSPAAELQLRLAHAAADGDVEEVRAWVNRGMSAWAGAWMVGG